MVLQISPLYSYVHGFNISNNSTPTSYPLQIRTYRAQSPQDTNFSIIQFCSVINEVVTVNSTISFCVGDGYGSGTFDLDDVFLGGIVEYKTSDDDFKIRTGYLDIVIQVL